MIELTKKDDVKAVQTNLRASLDSPSGKEVIKFLEQVCGWYDFSATDPNQILVAHGKRQVLATIKTIMNCTVEEIVAVAKKEGE